MASDAFLPFTELECAISDIRMNKKNRHLKMPAEWKNFILVE
jgi:hypothetical protein